MHRVLRVTAVVLAVLVVTTGIVLGPLLYHEWRWETPREPLAPITVDEGEEVAAGSLAPDVADAFRNAVVRLRNESGAPAISAAIAQGGAVLWAGAFGYRNLETQERASVADRFRIGSVSKSMTGIIFARLIEAGAIAPDTRLDALLDVPAHLHAVTPRMLASHTAGIRHYVAPFPPWPSRVENFLNRDFGTVEQGLELFLDDPLLFEPGTGFKYSTHGYSLLARALEVAGGVDFGTLLEREIVGPLSLQHLGLERASMERDGVAHPYATTPGYWSPAFPVDTSYKWAGGGMLASAGDLVRVGDAVLRGTILRTAERTLMLTPVPVQGQTGNPQNYGFGWRIDESKRLLGAERPVTIWHHGGLQIGGAAFLMIVPELQVTVAAVANSGDGAVRVAVQEVTYELTRAFDRH